ncbi:hypothetical protein EYF80_004370 [Liparis tanakae]|uniref:Uncharacterized protein n=1 Tax=Liparis tanakae TaxID=230148 RepID=A0A4Z2J6R6_9TELE|nr:hypothetical protein EYF80_004370 [Liparis tanakae]
MLLISTEEHSSGRPLGAASHCVTSAQDGSVMDALGTESAGNESQADVKEFRKQVGLCTELSPLDACPFKKLRTLEAKQQQPA